MLFLIFVRNENVCVEIANVDLETTFIVDAVSVAQRGGDWRNSADHVMDANTEGGRKISKKKNSASGLADDEARVGDGPPLR
jgi:hypothetical protein